MPKLADGLDIDVAEISIVLKRKKTPQSPTAGEPPPFIPKINYTLNWGTANVDGTFTTMFTTQDQIVGDDIGNFIQVVLPMSDAFFDFLASIGKIPALDNK